MFPISTFDISTFDLTSTTVEELVIGASKEPVLDEEREAQLAAHFHARAEDVLTVLVRTHLRVAVDEAIRSRGLGLRQEILVREAARALLEAAPGYDPSTDGSFREYSRRVAREAIARELLS